MKPNKGLEELDKNIAAWEEVVKKYPNSQAYKEMLDSQRLQRIFIANKIGIKQKQKSN